MNKTVQAFKAAIASLVNCQYSSPDNSFYQYPIVRFEKGRVTVLVELGDTEPRYFVYKIHDNYIEPLWEDGLGDHFGKWVNSKVIEIYTKENK